MIMKIKIKIKTKKKKANATVPPNWSMEGESTLPTLRKHSQKTPVQWERVGKSVNSYPFSSFTSLLLSTYFFIYILLKIKLAGRFLKINPL